jgi:hypothetical protein
MKVHKKIYNKRYYTKYPWMKSYFDAKDRCKNKNNPRYKSYGGRGIECLITKEEIKELWFRDRAWELKQPSIDRIDNDGNYTFENCQFIEMGENSGKDKRKPIKQFSLFNIFLKEFPSTIQAARDLNILNTSINNCLTKKTRTAGGFKWEYKYE